VFVVVVVVCLKETKRNVCGINNVTKENGLVCECMSEMKGEWMVGWLDGWMKTG